MKRNNSTTPRYIVLVRALVAVVAVFASAPALADVTIKMTSSDGERTLYLTSDLMCAKGADGAMIFDAKNEVMRILEPGSKRYHEMTKAQLQQMAEMAKQMGGMEGYEKKMEEARAQAMEAVKDLPEDQRAAAVERIEKQFGDMPGSNQPVYSPMNKTEKIAGYKCDGYTIRKGGAAAGELWTASLKTVDLSPDDIVVVSKMCDFFGSLMESSPMMAGALAELESMDPTSDQFLGFPVKRTELEQGKTMTTELVSIEKGAIDPSVFEIPADYSKAPGMGGR